MSASGPSGPLVSFCALSPVGVLISLKPYQVLFKGLSSTVLRLIKYCTIYQICVLICFKAYLGLCTICL